MKNLFIIMLLMSLFMYNCNSNKQEEYIILTNGRSEDPSIRRIGIHFTYNKIYFCKEKQLPRGSYSFFEGEFNSSVFQDCKQMIKSEFTNIRQDGIVLDATPYQIIYNLDSKQDTINFYITNLTNRQKEVLAYLISLTKSRELHSISFHKFPDSLLLSDRPRMRKSIPIVPNIKL